jgi:Zn-dependent protease
MFRSAWTIGRILGIPVRLHISLLLVVPYVAVSVARHGLPVLAGAAGVDPSSLVLPPLVWGGLMALSVFAAVALHELGHAVVALRQGGEVRQITLMILGGVTEIHHDDATPKQTAWMALAGPLVSLALGVGAAAAVALPLPFIGVDVRLGLIYFAFINIALAVFNMLPAYPLDGGRILRALLEMRFSRLRATRIAATVGRVLAMVAVLWSFAVALGGGPMNWMLLLIAGFVYFGAGVEEAAIGLQDRLKGLRASQAMVTRVATVDARRSAHAVARHMLFHGAAASIVRDIDGIYGVIVPGQLRDARGTAGELLSGPALVVRSDDDLGEVARRLQRSQQHGAVVLDTFNTIVGVVTHAELVRAMALKTASDAFESGPRGGRQVEAEVHVRRK